MITMDQLMRDTMNSTFSINYQKWVNPINPPELKMTMWNTSDELDEALHAWERPQVALARDLRQRPGRARRFARALDERDEVPEPAPDLAVAAAHVERTCLSEEGETTYGLVRPKPLRECARLQQASGLRDAACQSGYLLHTTV